MRPSTFWTLHTDAGRVDVFGEVPGGRPYDEIRGRAVPVEEPGGGRFMIVGLDDLVRMKRVAGRPKDLADLAALNLANRPDAGGGSS